jgi:hypothetical protein
VTPRLPFLDLPLTPDGDEARRWAEQELSDSAYATAQPNAFDRAARAVSDLLGRLFGGSVADGWAATIAIGVVLVVIVLIVVAVIVWGRPRAQRRARRDASTLFGDAEDRTAAQLRVAAAAAAERGDWGAAVVLRFRALARGLDERVLVSVAPGTTAGRFARDAGRAFPDAAPALAAAASVFDDVRYLGAAGTPERYGTVAAADEAVSGGSRAAVPRSSGGSPRSADEEEARDATRKVAG